MKKLVEKLLKLPPPGFVVVSGPPVAAVWLLAVVSAGLAEPPAVVVSAPSAVVVLAPAVVPSKNKSLLKTFVNMLKK